MPELQTYSVTTGFQCSDCQNTTFMRSMLTLGKNQLACTCGYCGEHWHLSFVVNSFDPLHTSDLVIRRQLGIIKDGLFFGKEILQ